MKSMDYHLFDVIFVIESTASCGVYLNEMKTSYIHPALEYFSSGLEDSNFYGIVLYNTSQCAPSNTCNTYGPFGAQKFLKTIDSLELTGGRSESNANLAEGLATALVCFQDLEKRHEKDTQIHKHCILVSNSPPYSMPVTECYEYEGKTVEQLATIFSEKNINLSIISPRKIPIFYEIFEKSGGDLGITAKNYSKDPRHLVLLKGFSLKELIHDKPADSPANQIPNQPQNPMQNVVAPQIQQAQQQLPQSQQANVPQQTQIMQGNEQMVQMTQMGINAQGNVRAINPNIIRANNPMAMPPNAGQNLPNQNPQFPGQMANFQQQQVQRAQNPQNTPQRPQWMQANQPAQNRPNQFIPANMMNANLMQNQAQQNSALLSQLNQPPTMNPSTMTPQQQQNIVRMAMQNPNQMNNPMGNQVMNPGMQGPQQGNIPMQNQNPIQQMPQQGNIMQNAQNQIQQQMPPQQQANMMQNNQNLNPQMGQQQGQQVVTQQIQQRERIWRGMLEWNDKQNQQNQMKQVPCEIFASISKDTNELEIRGDNWPQRLIMQLMPRSVISNVGGQLLRDAKVVIFQFVNSEPFESLSKVMASGFAGCVHFTNNQQTQCDVKILILLYMQDKKSFYGFVPNDQAGYVEKLRRVIQASKGIQYGQNQGPVPQQQQQAPNQPIQAQAQPQQIQQQGIPRQIMMPGMTGNQNVGNVGNIGNMMQGTQNDQQNMMFNQQMQMQGNQQRMTRPNMMQNNNLRHLLQQQQTQFRPQQMGGPQQNPQMHGMDYDMNFQMN
ncbi:hypothetical protein ACKWTF_006621 [Chironomus riparius]